MPHWAKRFGFLTARKFESISLFHFMIDSLFFLTFMCDLMLFYFCARLCVPFSDQL